MRVVSNTSPLFYLHSIRQIELLARLYGQIVVPGSVVDELEAGRAQGYDAPECRVHPWMRIESIAVPALLALMTSLGPGEAEALALALSEPTDLIILDDALARQIAADRNLRYTGTLGILIQSKQAGFLPTIMPLVSQLQQAGFYMTPDLIAGIRRAVNE